MIGVEVGILSVFIILILIYCGVHVSVSLGLVSFIGVWVYRDSVDIAISLLVVAAAIATLAARFRPNFLRIVFAIVALGQIGAGLYATGAMPGHAVEWGVLIVFAGIWSAAALCFHRAAIRPA